MRECDLPIRLLSTQKFVVPPHGASMITHFIQDFTEPEQCSKITVVVSQILVKILRLFLVPRTRFQVICVCQTVTHLVLRARIFGKYVVVATNRLFVMTARGEPQAQVKL